MKRSFVLWRFALAMLGITVWLPSPDADRRLSARAAPPSSEDGESEPRPGRPQMQTLAPSQRSGALPSQRALVDARSEFRQRYGNPAARVRTSSATLLLAEALMAEAAGETDPAVKWVILEEARKLAISAGSPLVVGRSVRVASAEFDFDALAVEYRSLLEIPLRAIDPGRASDLANAAAGVATRAEVDQRYDVAILAQGLTIRAWQRAGNIHAARAASLRLESLQRLAKSSSRRSPGGTEPGR